MGKKLKNNLKGFTIIEVTIVLAIAGIIMAIVFLAVPALQRNTRNTQRQSDAQHWDGVVNDYVANHNGGMPGGNSLTTTDTLSQLKSPATVVAGKVGALNAANFPAATTSVAVIDTNVTCDANAGTTTAQNGSFAIVWQYEPSGYTCISQ